MKNLTIGVTDCSKYERYADWIQAHGPEVEVIRLGAKYGTIEEAKRCHGIVLSGGEDVHPRFYNKPEYYSYCHADDVNEARDEYELSLLEYTEKNNVPVIGICRGLQIGNVFYGGTLIPDIPSWGKESHAKMADGSDFYHPVVLEKGSWLEKITRESRGMINSNHHQSVDTPAPSLVVNSYSLDGIVEGVERKDPKGKGFLCLIQWHPERMLDPDGKFTSNLRNAFMEAAGRYM